MLSNRKVKAILVNIFGGIMKCDVIAEGVLGALKKVKMGVPLVVRLEGTNVKEGKALLERSGVKMTVADSLWDAAQKAVVPLVRSDSKPWGIKPLNIEQRFALELLLDPDIQLVTLVGVPGSGKTVLALAAGLEQIIEKKRAAAVEGPVREQFLADLKALTDSEQDSKELKSAKSNLLYSRIIESV